MSTIDKGSRWRRKCQDFLEMAGCTTHARAWFDAGDDITASIENIELSIESKDHRTLALAGWVDQATKNAPPGAVPVVMAHRLGKAGVDDAYVVMSGAAFAQLLGMVRK